MYVLEIYICIFKNNCRKSRMSPIFWHEAALADQLLYVFFRKNIGFLFIVAMQANQKLTESAIDTI